jgi:hypothetical protein
MTSELPKTLLVGEPWMRIKSLPATQNVVKRPHFLYFGEKNFLVN